MTYRYNDHCDMCRYETYDENDVLKYTTTWEYSYLPDGRISSVRIDPDEISTSTEQEILIEHMVDRLPALRKKYGISQTELGEKIGLSRQTISAIERKTTPLTRTTMLAILMFFTANSNCVFYFPQRTEFKDAEMLHSALEIVGSATKKEKII